MRVNNIRIIFGCVDPLEYFPSAYTQATGTTIKKTIKAMTVEARETPSKRIR